MKRQGKGRLKLKEIVGFRAFNYLYFIYLFAFALSGGFFLYLLLAEDILSIVLLIISGIFFILLLIDDIYYIFTEKEIIFVHFLGNNINIQWSQIIKIIRSSGFESVKELPHYTLIVNELKDGVISKDKIMILATNRTKMCIQTFYKGEVTTSKKVKKDTSK